MVYFSSTAIRCASYDAQRHSLFLQFTSGPKIYEYPSVPEHIYRGLLSAPSKGQFYDRYIRHVYSVR